MNKNDYSNVKESKLFIELRDKCINEVIIEIQSAGSEEIINNKVVAIVRKYGKIWDSKKLDGYPNIAEGGFVKVIKKQLNNMKGFQESFYNAIRYL